MIVITIETTGESSKLEERIIEVLDRYTAPKPDPTKPDPDQLDLVEDPQPEPPRDLTTQDGWMTPEEFVRAHRWASVSSVKGWITNAKQYGILGYIKRIPSSPGSKKNAVYVHEASILRWLRVSKKSYRYNKAVRAAQET